MAQSLRFTVEVAADQATQALTAVSAALNQAGIEGRANLLRIGPAAQSAGKEIGSLTGKVKEYVSEQRGQGRIAGFFVREITEIVPASDAAKTAMNGLIGAMAGGFGAGMVIDLAITGIKLLVEELRAADKEIEDISKKGADRIAEVTKKIDELRNRGKTPGEVSSGQRRAAIMSRQDLADEMAELQAANAEEGFSQGGSRWVAGPEVAERTQRIAVIREEIRTLDAFIERKQQEIQLEVESADAVGADAAHKKARDAADKARIEEAQWRARAGEEYGKSEDANLLARADPQAMKRLMEQAHRPDTSGLPSVGGFYSLEAGGYDEKEIAQQRIKAMTEEQKQVEQLAASYAEWGAVGGKALAGIVTGQETLQDGMRTVLALAAKQIITAAFTASANSAVSGAWAGGPAGASVAMAATQALVLGLLSSLPSAAGGWQVPYDTLAMVHKDEKILPAEKSRKLDRLLDSGAGGPLIGTLVATNASSFARDLEDSGSALSRGLRRYDRRRRRS